MNLFRSIYIGDSTFAINENQAICILFVDFNNSKQSNFQIINSEFHFSESIKIECESSYLEVCKDSFLISPKAGILLKVFDRSPFITKIIFNKDEFACYSSQKDQTILSEKNPLKETFDNPFRKLLFVNEQIVWENKSFGLIRIFANNLILQFYKAFTNNKTFNQFSRLSFETGDRLWDFDLDEHLDKLVSAYPYEGAWLVPDHHPQIKEPIGIYKDQLWFSMKHYGLLCLNYHTGAFMHYLRDCPENDKRYGGLPYGNYPVIPHTENAVIVDDEGKMVCFDGMYYWELNLQTLSLDFHYLENYFRNEVSCHTHLTRFKKLIVENEKIYMVDNLHKKFGCFNRRTLKYDWIEPLPEGSGAPRSIEKHGNRLYIDTSKKELLVYELDEDE